MEGMNETERTIILEDHRNKAESSKRLKKKSQAFMGFLAKVFQKMGISACDHKIVTWRRINGIGVWFAITTFFWRRFYWIFSSWGMVVVTVLIAILSGYFTAYEKADRRAVAITTIAFFIMLFFVPEWLLWIGIIVLSSTIIEKVISMIIVESQTEFSELEDEDAEAKAKAKKEEKTEARKQERAKVKRMRAKVKRMRAKAEKAKAKAEKASIS